jgi:Tol biopolymer transport system component
MKLQKIIRIKLSTAFLLGAVLMTLPLICAAQEKIFFNSGRNGGAIYSMNPDGSLPTQLTNGTGDDFQPSASPDGSRVVFTSRRDFNFEIYIMNADGTEQTNLTNNFADDFQPAISPDGSRIAFVSFRLGGARIFLMNADGSNPTPLTFGIRPAFSPDGNKIVFAAFSGVSIEIYTINTDGTNLTQITQNTAEDNYPKFSPDGSRIGFISDRDGDTAVYIMNADSTAQTRVTGTMTDRFFPNEISFSPDGSRIAFTSLSDGNGEIYSIETNGENPRRLTNNPAFDGSPSWAGLPVVPPIFNAPTDLRVDFVGANQISLRWTDNSNVETGFVIEQCRNKNCSNTVQIGQVGADVATFLHTGLLPNTQYIYRVAAINSVGERTAYSNSLMVKTLRR